MKYTVTVNTHADIIINPLVEEQRADCLNCDVAVLFYVSLSRNVMSWSAVCVVIVAMPGYTHLLIHLIKFSLNFLEMVRLMDQSRVKSGYMVGCFECLYIFVATIKIKREGCSCVTYTHAKK